MRLGKCTEWKRDIDKAIVNVCLRIIKEPLLYFSEADIQVLLVEELRKIGPIGKTYPTSVQRGKGSKGTYRTSLVHREYGGGGRTRLDVVVFDPDEVAKIDNVNLTIGTKYLRPAYAFELGTEKTCDSRAHLENDFGKLSKRTKGTGYIIHIHKDVTTARTGTRSRQKTDEKIDRDFKEVLQAQQSLGATNIKILGILLRTYRKQARIWGKCEILSHGKWSKVNVTRDDLIRRAIMAQFA